MALDVLNTLNVEITAENFDIQIDSGVVRKILDWQRNGSQSTMAEFKKLKTHMRTVLLDYMEDFAPYEALETGDKLFILVHSGLGNFSVEKWKKLLLCHEVEIIFDSRRRT
jgi:serine/threonine protein phosphatase 1